MKKITGLAICICIITIIGCNKPPATQTTSTPQASSPQTTASKSLNPCDLLTASDVESQFPGKTATATMNETEANVVGQKICFYDLSEDEMIFAQLSLTNETDMSESVLSGGQSAKAIFQSLDTIVEDLEPVDGLGAEAYYGGSGLTPGSGLHVLHEDQKIFFTIVVGLGFGNEDPAEHLKIEKALAKIILSKL